MNAAEYEALDTEWLPNEARTLYLMCLRYRMDYATGIVGLRRNYTLSYQALREAIRVVRRRGSRLPDYRAETRELRYLLELLEEVGLIERTGQPLVFRLPLATTDLNRPDEERQRSGTHERRKSVSEKPRSSDAPAKSGSDERHTDLHDERHTSVTPSNNSLSCAGAEKKFPMFPSWDVFDQDRFAEQCALSDVCWDLMGLEQREHCRVEFVRYEMTEGRMATQEAWEHRFINTLVRQAEWGRVPSNGLAGRQSSYQ